MARQSFTRSRRGFDADEVTAFVAQVSKELEAWEQREGELLAQLAEAEERAANPEIDDNRLTSALGQKSAEVIRNAHTEAARLTNAAEETSAALVRDAQQQATDIQVSAEAAAAERIAQAELSAGAVHEDVQADVAAILERARSDGDSLLDRARERGRLMIEQAQETRRRMLTETAQRRRVLLIQIEQLRAARDQLARTVLGVRGTVDDIVSGLARADDDARAAAAAVAERVAEVEVQEVEGLEPADTEAITVGETAVEVEKASPNGAAAEVEQAAIGDDAKVEELFARIRDGRVAEPAESTASQASAESSVADVGVAQSVLTEELDRPTDADTSQEAPGVDPVVVERDDLLDPIIARMARRLKRAMQDDQNLLLHRLRSDAGEYRQELLSSEEEQRRGLVEASVDFLGDAFDAGENFAHQHLGPNVVLTPDGPEINRSAVGTGAQELADTVVTLLRRRLLEEDTEGPGPSEEEAAELVSAAYREWRGERIERLVGDHVIGAFSSGVRAGSANTPLRWVAAGLDEACADCDDNALAEAVGEGERFPTGHLHPPAHAGCRCLVVPTTT
ncbi:MAG: DivIVA domain-containing protein [Acidimicrobiales bacterium]